MATQAEVIRRNIQDNAARELQLSNYGAPRVDEVARGIPVLNDAALAASIEQWRATDIQYQRAANDEAREQIEAAYTAGQQRLNRAKQEIRDRGALETAQRNQADETEKAGILADYEAITAALPYDKDGKPLPLVNDYTVDIDKLRAAAINAEKIKRVTGFDPTDPQQVQQQPRQNQPQPRAETFPDGQAVHVTQNQDGTLHVEYATGEKFDGDPLTVTQRIGQAHVSTKLWARQQRAQAQPQAQPQVQPANENQNYSGSLSDDLASRQADAIARQLGFDNLAEAKQSILDMGRVREQVQQIENEKMATQFCNNCPEFPGTPDAIEAVTSIVENLGWEYNVDTLRAAHGLALQKNLYQPLTEEQIQIANGAAPQQHRNAPPPMLHTGNPEISNQQLSPYDMPMGDLRKAAIRQELERQGPNYR